MDPASSQRDQTDEKACHQCAHSMPTEAALCSTCNSYQDWRGVLPVTTSALAVLAALISVISLALPPAIKVLHRPKSDAYLTIPSFDGTTLRVLAVNKGDAPAVLMPARVTGEVLPRSTKVRLRNDNSAYISPGTHQITFDIVPPFSGDQAYSESLQMLKPAVEAVIAQQRGKRDPSNLTKPVGNVVIGVIQSDGAVSVQSVPITANDMFHLLQSDADRCEAEKNPTFENGCIGTGAPD